MTYTYKLARRLAGARSAIVGLMLVVGCDSPTSSEPTTTGLDTALRSADAYRLHVVPDSLTLEAAQAGQFQAYTLRKNDSTVARVAWSATGGNMTTLGSFSSAAPGRYLVIATARRTIPDTAVVVVIPHRSNVVTLTVSPDTATVAAGATKQFTARAKLADSTVQSIGTSWSATGGAIDAGGVFTGGTTPGHYRVVAASVDGTVADTAAVVIPEAPTPVPPTITQVVLTPTTATLAPSATQQFAAFGRTSTGDSVAATATFSATGGMVSSGGLYTAGPSAGQFRVIALIAGGLADTSNVTISAPAPTPTPTHAGHQVTPTGGTGSEPWSLAYALSGAGGRILAGDTVWVRGGTYAGDYNSTLRGSTGSPVIVRAWPGERATITGHVSIGGSDAWYWGLELDNVTEGQNVMGFDDQAPRTKLINNIVHDYMGNGIGIWAEAPDGEVTGNIVYNNGYCGIDGAPPSCGSWGHGIYVQNTTGAGKLLRDNVIFQTFGYGVHGYAASTGLLNLTLRGNVAFQNGMKQGANLFVGGGPPANNLLVENNTTYQVNGFGNGINWFGYNGATSSNGTIRNNWLVGGQLALRLFNWSGVSVTGNNFVRNPNDLLLDTNLPSSGVTFAGNTWYGTAKATGEYMWAGGGGDFGSWRSATGLGGSDTRVTALPTGQNVFVRANGYEPGRANVAVYNWSGAGSASANLTGILTVGQAYEVRNAQRIWDAPVMTGTYGGGSISIPLVPVTGYTPKNGWPGAASTTGNTFHVFVVAPVGTLPR
jgi:hypothetical protein